MTLPRLRSSYPQCMFEMDSRECHSFDSQVTVTSNVSSTTDESVIGDNGDKWDTLDRMTTSSTCISEATPSTKKRLPKKNAGFKSLYKHVPHKDKPPHLVARRNARERRRVQAVNSAFARLRKCVPVENRNKRLSKVKTLHKAIEYIGQLQDLIDTNDSSLQNDHQQMQFGQENVQHNNRWTTMEMTCREPEYEDYASFCDDFDDYAN